jgi:hypothetical protein
MQAQFTKLPLNRNIIFFRENRLLLHSLQTINRIKATKHRPTPNVPTMSLLRVSKLASRIEPLCATQLRVFSSVNTNDSTTQAGSAENIATGGEEQRGGGGARAARKKNKALARPAGASRGAPQTVQARGTDSPLLDLRRGIDDIFRVSMLLFHDVITSMLNLSTHEDQVLTDPLVLFVLICIAPHFNRASRGTSSALH